MKCPGQDSRYWDGGAIFDAKCANCGHEIEFFKDDNRRKCPNCGTPTLNPQMDFGCASYCPHAEQCLGSLPPELLAQQQDLLIERVHMEMRKYFGEDHRRIDHAAAVARHAREILATYDKPEDEGLNPAVVLITAYLHDIGIKNAEEKFGSSSPKYQHQEGPPVARAMLEEMQANPGLTDEVCDIISHHHTPRGDDSINFKAVYDADLIVNLRENHDEKPMAPDHLEKVLAGSFLTTPGAAVARKVLAEALSVT